MPQPNDLSRSLVALDQNSTIIAVVELSQSSWLVGGVVPGIERQPRKKLEPSPERLLAVLHRWRDEAVRAGRTITRIALAFEAGRDGFWLARWLEVATFPRRPPHSIFRFRASGDTLSDRGVSRKPPRAGCHFGEIPPQGDLDDGTVSQLLEELAGEMDRTLGKEEARIARG